MKRLFTVFILTCLYCFCLPIPAYATQKNEAAHFSEFKNWLIEHRRSGGTLNLTDDITVDETFVLELLPTAPLIINTNQFTIYVQSELTLISYDFTKIIIQGEGGENGLIQVLPQGICNLEAIQINALDHQTAAIQSENSALKLNKENIINGSVQYAKHPVLYDYLHKSYLDTTILNSNQPLTAQMLPQTDNYIYVCYQGEAKPYNLPIQWNINEYNELNPYQYYFYHGQLTGDILFNNQPFQLADIHQLYTPTTRVISTPGGLAITDVKKKWNQFYQQTFHTITLSYQQLPTDYEIYIRSNVNDEWIQTEVFQIEEAAFNHTTDLIIANESSYLEYYIKVHIDDQEYNSNIAVMDEDDLSYRDYEGGRGGGIDILPDHEEEEDAEIDNKEPEQNIENTQPENPENENVQEPLPQNPLIQDKPILLPSLSENIFSHPQLKKTKPISSNHQQIPQNHSSTKPSQNQSPTAPSQNQSHQTQTIQKTPKSQTNASLQIMYGVLCICGIITITAISYLLYTRKKNHI